ncbi:MAG: toll/interleukin-1 receptor domain-containing protein [Pseudomonadota bacterium]
MSKAVFISYRRIDTNWAAVAIRHHVLKAFPGTEVFMDIASIEPGADFVDAINRMVDRCEVLLAIIGPNWLTVSTNEGRRRLDIETDFVRLEIARALHRNIRTIPVLVDDATMPPESQLPHPLQPLTRRHAITVSQASNDRDLEDLCGFLEGHMGLKRQAEPPTPKEVKVVYTPRIQSAGDDVAQALLDAGVDVRTIRQVANMRRDEGRYDILEALRRIEVELLTKSKSSDSPEVITARHNHAYALLNFGRAEDAEAAFRVLLTLREKVQGAEHPDTLTTRQEHARALLELGRAEDAEADFRDLLTLREKVLGAEHPSTLTTRHGHALALLNLGRTEEAEAAFRDLLTLREKVQGAEHPSTFTTRYEHALALLNLGRTEAAEAAFRDLLPLREKVQGAEHPHTLTTRHEHARALLNLGQAEAAEAAFRDLLPLYEKVQGAEHPRTLVTRHNHATALLNLGQAEAAEAAFRDLLPLREKVEGAKHPGTLVTRRALVRAALEAGDVAAARVAMAPLPEEGGDAGPLAKWRTALLRAWFADLDGDAAAAEVWLERAEAFLADRAPEHYARRELARYWETRVPGGAGGTTLPEGVRRV